ncbi:hypothetical protein BH10PSE14_BH10PSE14_35160 [soil metagenome]
MTTITVTVDGVPKTITDITAYRAQLEAVRDQLKAIYTGFDPARPERLLAREAEIVTLYNRYEDLRELVERWDAEDSARANILAAWTLIEPSAGGSS